MSKKVYVEVTTRLIIRMEEGKTVESVIENMDYWFSSNSDSADIEEMEIRDFVVTDVK